MIWPGDCNQGSAWFPNMSIDWGSDYAELSYHLAFLSAMVFISRVRCIVRAVIDEEVPGPYVTEAVFDRTYQLGKLTNNRHVISILA